MEYLSQECYNKLVAELNELINVELPKVKNEIAEARDKGDLSENLSIMQPSVPKENSWAGSDLSRECCSMPE